MRSETPSTLIGMRFLAHRVRRNSTTGVFEYPARRNSFSGVSEDPHSCAENPLPEFLRMSFAENLLLKFLRIPVRSGTLPTLIGNEVSGAPGVQKFYYRRFWKSRAQELLW